MSTGFTSAPPYSEVPFEDRRNYAQDIAGHYALILNAHQESLVKIVDFISDAYPYRKFEVAYNHDFGRHLGLASQPFQSVEVREKDLIPVDPTDPHWLEKAHTWRASRRAQALNQTLSPSRPPPTKPLRF